MDSAATSSITRTSSAATAARIATDFEGLLASVLARPDTRLEDLDAFAGRRRRRTAGVRKPKAKSFREIHRRTVDLAPACDQKSVDIRGEAAAINDERPEYTR